MASRRPARGFPCPAWSAACTPHRRHAGGPRARGTRLASVTGSLRSPRCPCGTGLRLAECCGPLHEGTTTAATAEQLMRSRYSAFAVGDAGYLSATWHPDTRPRSVELDPDVRWTGLDVLASTRGSMLDAEGTVEFTAHYIVG